MASKAAQAAAAYAALRTAAHVADHWIQTGHQAAHKADAGVSGHKAMAGHIASYAAAQAAALVVVDQVLDARLSARGIVAAVAFSAATHWFIDRRWPVRKLAEATGKLGFHDAGEVCGKGSYVLDQAAHHLMEGVAAVVAAKL